jgi:hypothetical protein
MAREEIPDDVRRFILTSISSVPFLEAMLLMRGERDAPWRPKRLAQRLYVSEKTADALLLDLCNAGFVKEVELEGAGYQFDPASEELAVMCDRLATVYASNIVLVTNLIHSNVGRRAQQFADAFKWRKD